MASVDLRNHIDCSQGKVFLDGEECMDATAFSITFTPVINSTKTLGHTGADTRWKGHDIAVSISEYRSKDWIKQAIQKYLEDSVTPSFAIQGVCTDEHSDYFKEYGGQTVTVTGCVPNGAISILAQDVNSDFVQDTITFTGKDMSFS